MTIQCIPNSLTTPAFVIKLQELQGSKSNSLNAIHTINIVVKYNHSVIVLDVLKMVNTNYSTRMFWDVKSCSFVEV
jgi:hypothetical protein